ncbi:LytR/AlgR family response regulator transcription factor [Kordiimonas sp.]|uniref:LytR/AlgR family response regulator transcription factor n=1 Tax=Kordiimonas sp. TaxID=1970157 RepID=UPI003A94AB35
MIKPISEKLMTLQPGLKMASPSGFARAYGLSAVIWFLLALLFAAEGYILSRYRGGGQPWWPSFGYSLAIFSIWALISPLLLRLIGLIEKQGLKPISRASLYTLGLAIINPLHVMLFVLVYWPFYNDGGRIATRLEMGERMIVQNLHTNLIFYAVLVLIGVGMHALKVRELSKPDRQAEPTTLSLRTKGSVRLLAHSDINWIAAAGNYAEVHTTNGAFLADDSLSALQAQLPASSFARIHRGHLVRTAAISEVKSLGRGDARVMLKGGTELRLSRRYREALTSLLGKDSR